MTDRGTVLNVADARDGALLAIAELPDEDLRRGLAHLQAAEFLYETRLFPETEYTFKHALTHEVAYGSLLAERRRALHTRIVEAIESLYPERLVEHAERLAHHAVQGEVWDKALTYLRQAGTKAVGRAAYVEIVAWLEQALGALRHLPESRKTMEQSIDMRFDLRSALLPLGETGRIFHHLREAEGLAEALDDHRRLGWVSAYMTIYFLIAKADNDEALRTGERALSIATALDDFDLQTVANDYLGWVSVALGDYRRATNLFRWSVESLKGDRIRERFRQAALPSVFSRAWLADCLAELGAFAQGITTGEVRPIYTLAVLMMRPRSRYVRWSFRVIEGNAATKPGPCASSARSHRIAISTTQKTPRSISGKPSA